MNDHLSTKEVGWVLGRSPGSVREMVKAGEIDGSRIATGFRVAKAEVLRLARDKVEAEGGGTLSDRELERLVDDVIATNEAATT